MDERTCTLSNAQRVKGVASQSELGKTSKKHKRSCPIDPHDTGEELCCLLYEGRALREHLSRYTPLITNSRHFFVLDINKP